MPRNSSASPNECAAVGEGFTIHNKDITDIGSARGLMDDYVLIDRGEVVIAGAASDMVEADVRHHLTV